MSTDKVPSHAHQANWAASEVADVSQMRRYFAVGIMVDVRLTE